MCDAYRGFVLLVAARVIRKEIVNKVNHSLDFIRNFNEMTEL